MNQRKIGVLLTYGILGCNIIVGLFYTPFMLSKLGDSQYGIYSLSNSLISFITLLDLGFGQTLVRYISKYRALDDVENEAKLNGFFLILYIVIAVVALFIGVIVMLIYPQVCEQTLSLQEIHYFRSVFSLLLANVVISFPLCIFSATLNAFDKYGILKATNLIILVVKYICMVFLLLKGHTVVGITLVACAASIGMQLIYMVYCIKRLKMKFVFHGFEPKLVREVFGFSFFVFINLVVDFLYNNTDKLILGAVQGTTAVTIYSIGIYFTSYFQELSTAISGVFMPKIVYLYEKEKDMGALSNLFLRVGRVQLAILMLALSGFILLGEEFIYLWVGDGFEEAYFIGLLILIPSLIPLSQNIGVSIVRAMNLHKYRSYMYLIIAIINVIVSIPLSVKYSGIGAAVGTCISNILGQILFMNWFYDRKIGIKISRYWIHLGKMAIMVVVLVSGGAFIKQQLSEIGWVEFFVLGCLYTGMYSVCYACLIADSDEKKTIKNIICKLTKRK